MGAKISLILITGALPPTRGPLVMSKELVSLNNIYWFVILATVRVLDGVLHCAINAVMRRI